MWGFVLVVLQHPRVGERLACKSLTYPLLGPYCCTVQTENTMLHDWICLFTEKYHRFMRLRDLDWKRCMCVETLRVRC